MEKTMKTSTKKLQIRLVKLTKTNVGISNTGLIHNKA
jgi:hypothetical protein